MVIRIECDKKIKRLNIEFDDGYETDIEETEILREQVKKDLFPKEKKSTYRKSEPKLDTSEDHQTDINQEVVEKPVIEEKERAPMVAQEMQNLEF